MTLDKDQLKEMNVKELEKELKAHDKFVKENGPYSSSGPYSSYFNRWNISSELRDKRKLAKVKASTNKYCDNCPSKLLCTMSNAKGPIYARDKLDMKLDGASFHFSDRFYNRKEEVKTKFSIPLVKAGFEFSLLPNHSDDNRGGFYGENVSIDYRVMPLNYNKRKKTLSFVKYEDLPTTQLDYDKNYDYYALVYDNLATYMHSGCSSWYLRYGKDCIIDTTKLDKFQCPILLEETFVKSLRSIRGQTIKQSVREEYGKEKKTHFNTEKYNILTLHQIKKNGLYIPIKINPINKTKAQIKETLELYRKDGIIELPPMKDVPRELW